MKKPQELRAEAAAQQAAAKAIYEAVKNDASGRDFTEDELRTYDAALDKANKLFDEAGTIEAREKLWAAVDAKRSSAPAQLPHNDPANTANGRHQYSIMRAIRSRLPGAPALDGIELEVHQELAKRKAASGGAAQGIMIPWDVSIRSGTEQRALDTTAGTGSIPTILDGTLIDLLRARLSVVAMGATVMTDMQGLFAIPRQNLSGTSYWVAEGSAPTASNQTIDQVPFSPKTVGAYTDYTRRFMEQTNQDAEAFVKRDLTAILARAIETAAINGSGSSNQPKGIMARTGDTPAVGLVSLGTNGANPAWANIVALEAIVATANADFGNLGYLTNAPMRGYLKSTTKVPNFPSYIWNPDAPQTPLNGYQCGVTNLVPANLTKGTGTALSAILFGNWADLVIPMWSGIDLLVDPYTGSSIGSIRIVALQDLDINLRHPESFAVIVDGKTS